MKISSKNWINKLFLSLLLSTYLNCCSVPDSSNSASWYVNPKENDSQNLYGVSYGANLEEATKAALSDAATRLNVSISSNSTLLREENKHDINEETRQKIEQIVQKVDFGNFKVSKSKEINQKIFVEVKIDRKNFIKIQKENITFLEEKINNLEKTIEKSNPIQKRVTFLKLVDLAKEVELKIRILKGAGEELELKNILSKREFFENQLNLLTNKIEFYLEINSTKEMSQLIKKSLTKENIIISNSRNSKTNQILLNIKSSSKNEKIYSAYITKLYVDFENSINGQIIAASSLEVMGSSAIDEKQSYLSALKSLEDKIEQNGILKIIGITN
ncbi:MAG: hypothetical protein FJ368_04185 [Pelagibacterales bacterium]|nr:hypothetical protein [Pelagibacterales bacterium]